MGTKTEWKISNNKFIRLFGNKVTFQRTTINDSNHRSRGVTINESIFLRMNDVSIHPNFYQELSDNIVLQNDGKRIQLTKYCQSSDKKCCNGGFFNFTEMEWQHFWNTLRDDIIQQLFL